ncbi:MAG: glycosyltransferase [Tannerella sp.]|jgi:SAM-dependent methyltransferase|nr:glycosyltransferase [Tannerella sp.]
MTTKDTIRQYYNALAPRRQRRKQKMRCYNKSLEKYFSFIIPAGSRVLEIGCGTGELLNAVQPSYGAGIDFSPEMIGIAKASFPDLHFTVDDIEELRLAETFDYIILSDLAMSLVDVHKAFQNLSKVCHAKTRIVISNYNYLWEPILKLSEKLGMKPKQPNQNWLSTQDIKNLLYLTGFEMIKKERKVLLPVNIPLVTPLLNRFLANLPLFSLLSLVNIIVARPLASQTDRDYSVSVIVPARNEKGNIENAVKRLPQFGLSQEFVFIEGHSSDNTYEEMLRVREAYPDKNIKVATQTGKGKGNAVREGFEMATGDILFILDADLTTPPEDMPKFYNALKENRGELINGCRLVYPMDKQAMRLLNLIANKSFGLLFSYLLGQNLKDTLCGTKVLFKSDYENIKHNRAYFGDFDPFGDFDLLFGAAKLNMKITEIIVRYKDREYGSTQISRFKHGWLLVKMCIFAAKKIKFI